MLVNLGKMFDSELKPKMKACIDHPDVDEISKYHIGSAMFYIEHDLCDGRNPALRVSPVAGVLNDESFYKDVYKGQKSEAVNLLRNLGQAAKAFLDACLKEEGEA